MPEYLSKEEIRQWRSSLERITLEDFAARLGKTIPGERQTNDMVDKVMSKSLNTMPTESFKIKAEKIQTIAIKSFEKEKELMAKVEPKQPLAPKKPAAIHKPVEAKEQAPVKKEETRNDETNLTFKKSLTSREQMIFEHFLANKNSIVYAKDLARILELPRDYVYKYIKNLRSKINEDVLFNADNGGYILKA